MIREIVKRTPKGFEVISCEIIPTPDDKPFNPDGFIDLIAEALVKELFAEMEANSDESIIQD